MSTSERAQRNREILAATLAGEPAHEIAKRFDLSERQLRRAAADARGYSLAALQADPEALASRVLDAHLKALDRLEDLASSRNQSVGVAAARAMPNAAASLAVMAQNFGVIPASPGWRFLGDAGPVIRLILSAAESAGIPKSALRESLEHGLRTAGPLVVGRVTKEVDRAVIDA